MMTKVELPLLEPLYSTYHSQGSGTAVLANNSSIRNWYLNNAVSLMCNTKFLNGFTTPELSVVDSNWNVNPYFNKKWFGMQFLKGHVNSVIHNLLDAGYYVCYAGVDDYYVEGKTWYQEKHFFHDGLICGYDNEEKTYCIYAYDKNWVYRKFWTPQKAFERGRQAMFKKNRYGYICGIKPKEDTVYFSSETTLKKIQEYLNSKPKDSSADDDIIYGIVVHDYIAKYVENLYDGSIPYEKMDRRIFRLIWEHKKVMLERMILIEDAISIDHSISEAYKSIVREADNCRMLYAAHHIKQRNSVLPIIQKKLLLIKETERSLLEKLIEKSKGDKK